MATRPVRPAPGRVLLRAGVALAVLTLLATGLSASAEVDRSAGEVVLAGSDRTSSVLLRTKRLSVRGKVLGGPLIPGVKRTLRVRIANPHPFPVKVTLVKGVARQPAVAACRPNWVKVKPFRVTKTRPAIRVRAGGVTRVKLPIRLVNLKRVNQDACKGVTFRVRLSATARKA